MLLTGLELTAVDGALPIQEKADHGVEGVRFRVGLGGNPAVDDGEHVAGVDALQGPLDALRLASLVVVDVIRGKDMDTVA
jgi:hypothetical protein